MLKILKSNLRGLAEGIREFESDTIDFIEPPAPNIQTQPQYPTHPQYPTEDKPPASTPPQEPTFSTTIKEKAPSTSRPFQARLTERVVELQQSASEDQILNQLDEKSLALAKKVQEGLNLSTTQEALRVLIAVGYEQIKKILPKPEVQKSENP